MRPHLECGVVVLRNSRAVFVLMTDSTENAIGWLRSVGSIKLQVSFAKEPCKRNNILQKRPIILRSLRIEATPYTPEIHQIKRFNLLGANSNSQFEFVPRDTQESELPDLVDFESVVFSVKALKYVNQHKHFVCAFVYIHMHMHNICHFAKAKCYT